MIKVRIFLGTFTFLAIVCAQTAIPQVHPASSSQTGEDEAAIRKIVADNTDAYNRRDAKGLAKHLSADADHIGVTGGWTSSRAELEKALTLYFASPRSVTSHSLDKIRFLTSEVAIAIVRRQYRTEKETKNSISTYVFQKLDGTWQIAAFQNTFVQPPESAESTNHGHSGQ